MAKKGKGGKGKKEGGKKEASKQGAIDDKPKPPTEKELFEMQLQELREQLRGSDESLQTRTAELEAWRVRFEEELDSEESCVAHLERVLQRESERRSDVQERLRTERDLGELAERRALGKSAVADQSHEASKCYFLQEKMELQGDLYLLEERRLIRNNQRTNLAQVEAQMLEKMSNLREMTREKDATQVDRLLRNREYFVRMCDNIKVEWKEAFKLRMPVQAKQELAENIRLRAVCRDTTRNLLKTQNRNRILKKSQKSMDLEEEIQTFAEKNAEERRIYQEHKVQELLQIQKRAFGKESGRSDDVVKLVASQLSELGISHPPEETFSPNKEESHLGVIERNRSSSASKQDSDGRENPRVTTSNMDRNAETTRPILADECTKDAVDENISSIRRCEIAQCRLNDACRDVGVISGDQAAFERSLGRQMADQAERNGVMMSATLRAGEIFESRCSKGELRRGAELDFDVLCQIQTLLDLFWENA